MNTFFRTPPKRKTKVTILATYTLVQEFLKLLLESDRELTVLDIAGTPAELVEKAARDKPDVVLICLMNNEGKNIEVMPELLKAAPQTKAVVLSSPDCLLDQTAALKLGVTGIVGTNQNVRVLIRALRQVSEGEVWLNQKLIAQLLGGTVHYANGKSKDKGMYSDELTARELEVVAMIGLGMKNKDISSKLYISEATVRHHLSSIYSKLDVDDRLNLAIYAYRQRLVQPGAKAA